MEYSTAGMTEWSMHHPAPHTRLFCTEWSLRFSVLLALLLLLNVFYLLNLTTLMHLSLSFSTVFKVTGLTTCQLHASTPPLTSLHSVLIFCSPTFYPNLLCKSQPLFFHTFYWSALGLPSYSCIFSFLLLATHQKGGIKTPCTQNFWEQQFCGLLCCPLSFFLYSKKNNK